MNQVLLKSLVASCDKYLLGCKRLSAVLFGKGGREACEVLDEMLRKYSTVEET